MEISEMPFPKAAERIDISESSFSMSSHQNGNLRDAVSEGSRADRHP
jgi:hypothetical protein